MCIYVLSQYFREVLVLVRKFIMYVVMFDIFVLLLGIQSGVGWERIFMCQTI